MFKIEKNSDWIEEILKDKIVRKDDEVFDKNYFIH